MAMRVGLALALAVATAASAATAGGLVSRDMTSGRIAWGAAAGNIGMSGKAQDARVGTRARGIATGRSHSASRSGSMVGRGRSSTREFLYSQPWRTQRGAGWTGN